MAGKKKNLFTKLKELEAQQARTAEPIDIPATSSLPASPEPTALSQKPTIALTDSSAPVRNDVRPPSAEALDPEHRDESNFELAVLRSEHLADPDWFSPAFSPLLTRVRSELEVTKLQKVRLIKAASGRDPMSSQEVEEILGRLLVGADPDVVAADLGLPAIVTHSLLTVLPLHCMDKIAFDRFKGVFENEVLVRQGQISKDFEETRSLGRKVRASARKQLEAIDAIAESKPGSLIGLEALDRAASIVGKGTDLVHRGWTELQNSPTVVINQMGGASSFFGKPAKGEDPLERAKRVEEEK